MMIQIWTLRKFTAKRERPCRARSQYFHRISSLVMQICKYVFIITFLQVILIITKKNSIITQQFSRGFDHLLFHLIYIYQRYLNFVDEYPCRQPLSLKSEFNITLDNITCDKRTFEWYKRNNSNEDVDDGVRYNKGCKMSYECGEGACLTNNTETCLNEDESPKFTCELSKIIITTTQRFLSLLH